MDIYRAILTPHSATRTPWQADTLFGHLCWAKLFLDGDTALADFLAAFKEEPPLVFSNGFPGDYLPKPLIPIRGRPEGPQDKAAQVDAMQVAKTGKGVRWISRDVFENYRAGQPQPPTEIPRLTERRTVLKNAINRLTGGTTPLEEEPGGGNLYNADELMFVDTQGGARNRLSTSVYVKVADQTWTDEAKRLLDALAAGGYGAKKSAGYGHFEIEAWEPYDEFQTIPETDANGFISLSNWVPAAGDPTAGYYATLVKYGKLGETLANSENPFKFPLVMLQAGSAFFSDGPPREWYGRLVSGIAPGHEAVVQYGYAFVVPAYLAREE